MRTWMIGANAVAISAASLAIFPWFFSGKGSIQYLTHNLVSPQLKNSRPLIAYFPPSYNENPYKVFHNLLICLTPSLTPSIAHSL